MPKISPLDQKMWPLGEQDTHTLTHTHTHTRSHTHTRTHARARTQLMFLLMHDTIIIITDLLLSD